MPGRRTAMVAPKRVLAGAKAVSNGWLVAACYVPKDGGITPTALRYDQWLVRGPASEAEALEILWGETVRPGARLFIGQQPLTPRQLGVLRDGPALEAMQDTGFSGFTADAGRANAARAILEAALAARDIPERSRGRSRGRGRR